ncbi:MAG: flagellar biosynthesis protein FlhB [Clostridiales bacterium]|jgi:flagellar biosynthetic protein FlhB|nr:flagellar biosynthesis protein FlhB [Clostridiales bacterium]MDR2752399.1 flagellar biosynthesis protein FlhB [Clostridiales bacterium]
MAELLSMDLSFFGGDKTEKATPKKKSKARSEGQVARSQEIGTALLFLGMFTAMKAFAPSMIDSLMELFRFGIGQVGDVAVVFDINYAPRLVTHFFAQALLVAAPLLAVALVLGLAANLAQTGWQVTPNLLGAKLGRLNPISGMKRLFSPQSLLTLLKSLAKFGVIGAVIYNMLREKLEILPGLAEVELWEGAGILGSLMIDMGMNVGGWFVAIAVLDYAYQRYSHNKKLMMSKQEVKEEAKQAEGNPQVKGKIRSKMREASMRRMMSAVPHADVIITNPTHYACALEYDREGGGAPIVTAKGMDHLARRIKDAAKAAGVFVHEDKELARALYSMVEVGDEIPPELYQAVAEILAFVYRMKGTGMPGR